MISKYPVTYQLYGPTLWSCIIIFANAQPTTIC